MLFDMKPEVTKKEYGAINAFAEAINPDVATPEEQFRLPGASSDCKLYKTQVNNKEVLVFYSDTNSLDEIAQRYTTTSGLCVDFSLTRKPIRHKVMDASGVERSEERGRVDRDPEAGKRAHTGDRNGEHIKAGWTAHTGR